MFLRTFRNSPELQEIGDLGMNITGITTLTGDINPYYEMFAGIGTDDAVTSITLPAGGPIALFTEPGSAITNLSGLYNEAEQNGAFSGAGWMNKYTGYDSINPNWI
jgi:hypothetical protein